MIHGYVLRDGRLEDGRSRDVSDLTRDRTWIDVVAPTEEERRWLSDAYGWTPPSPSDLREIEASSRFFEDEDGTHIRAFFLSEADGRVRNETVAFVLGGGMLFTVREASPLDLRSFVEQTRRTPGLVRDEFEILLRLFEHQVDRLADLLEDLHGRLEAVDERLLKLDDEAPEGLMAELAATRDVNEKIRLSLMDKERALSITLRRNGVPERHEPLAQEILRDVESLQAHTAFLSDRLEALLHEIVGRVTIAQNRIIKALSIAAVVFLPPTLIASAYGMNFDRMPELGWPFGYPLAVLAMLASGLLPLWFLKRRGWL